MLFKFMIIYKNIVVEMGDGEWLVRLVKYEFFFYNKKKNKVKYLIGCKYLIVLILCIGIFFEDFR